jgi:antitoxin PrlF
LPRPSQKSVVSKVSVKSQTVLPREVRERLGIGPGDRLRYLFDADGIRIEKETRGEDDDPFIAFTEWASPADDEAYGDL